MATTLEEILSVLGDLAPASLAEDWDTVGLQLGHGAWPVRRILIALDPTLKVVAEAAQREADLVVTHHPLFFKALRVIDCATPVGAIIEGFLARHIGLLSAHTNLDSVQGGVNDALAGALGLQDTLPLQPAEAHADCGLGRIGRLMRPLSLAALARDVKRRLAINNLRMVGMPQLEVARVAICSGSGAGLLDAFFASDAEVFITGDVRYHDAREVEARQRGLIDIGHFESEHLVLQHLAVQLDARLRAAGKTIEVLVAQTEETPFRTV